MGCYQYSANDISNSLKYSLCNETRMNHLHKAVWQVSQCQGDMVEIGVAKGGSSMCMALSLMNHLTLKDIHLYDTFAGMVKPTEEDCKKNKTYEDTLRKYNKYNKGTYSEWCLGTLDEVKINMARTMYPKELIHYHKGDITKEVDFIPEKIALLRIDVDFYLPTKAAIEKFYPKLVKGGILIMDDYNAWNGARKAWVDFRKENKIKQKPELIDRSAAWLIKE